MIYVRSSQAFCIKTSFGLRIANKTISPLLNRYHFKCTIRSKVLIKYMFMFTHNLLCTNAYDCIEYFYRHIALPRLLIDRVLNWQRQLLLSPPFHPNLHKVGDLYSISSLQTTKLKCSANTNKVGFTSLC